MNTAINAPVGALADLRGVIRIAKAASIGVTGNAPRIAKAEAAVEVLAEFIEAVMAEREATGQDLAAARARTIAVLARMQGGAK